MIMREVVWRRKRGERREKGDGSRKEGKGYVGVRD